LLFDGVSIEKLNLCVKARVITIYGLAERSQADGAGFNVLKKNKRSASGGSGR